MSKLKDIHKAIQNILDTLPNHSKRVYLLEDYHYVMETIEVMYDSYSHESKAVYIDKNGVYIAGRNQGQGDKSKLYFSEFDRLELDEETKTKVQEEIDKLNSKLDTRIPSKDIKVGHLVREYKKYECDDDYHDYYVYLGKLEYKRYIYSDREVYTEHIYLDIGNKGNLVDLDNRWLYVCNVKSKSKLRFDEIVRMVNNNELNKLRLIAVKDMTFAFDEKWI